MTTLGLADASDLDEVGAALERWQMSVGSMTATNDRQTRRFLDAVL